MTSSSVSQTHRDLLQNLLSRLENQELRFYEKSAKFHYWSWSIGAYISFLSSILVTLLTSLASQNWYATQTKTWIIVISIAGASASGLSNLYKDREKEALREEGRIELEYIIALAKSYLISATNEAEFKDAFFSIHERFKQLELNQHHRDVTFRSDPTTNVT